MQDIHADRLKKWQDNLLDLSMRNPLLNYRGNRRCLPIVCPDPALLKDKLAKGKPIRIVRYPHPEEEDFPWNIEISLEVLLGDEEAEFDSLLPIDDFAVRQIRKAQAAVVVDMAEAELSRKSVEIYRRAKSALEEGGAGILYLAFGFLEWQREDEDQIRRAPLFLVPVRLERKSAREGVRIVASDDEPRVNKTLMEMLRRDYDVHIPELDGELPLNESGAGIPKIWEIFAEAVSHLDNFVVTHDVLLDNFSFAKYLMWADLVSLSQSDKLSASNSVVNHLMHTPTMVYNGGGEAVKVRTLDQEFKPRDLLMPLEADSSQTACVAAAAKGNNFIIIGPPGTGKSQTIANIIAHMLGNGKNVLFVSEKMAALDVVYRRLKEIGLEKFCLELHSRKANKKDVLAQLKEASEVHPTVDNRSWNRQSDNLLYVRDNLNRLPDALNAKRSNGHSVFEGIGLNLKHAYPGCNVELRWDSADVHNIKDLEALENAAEALGRYGQSVDPRSNVYAIVDCSFWGAAWERELVEKAENLSRSTNELGRALNALASKLGTPIRGMNDNQLKCLVEIGSLLSRGEAVDACRLLSAELEQGTKNVRAVVYMLKQYRRTEEKLSCYYPDFKWRTLDIPLMSEALKVALASWWLTKKIKLRKLKKTLRSVSEGAPDPAVDIPVLVTMAKLDSQISVLAGKLASLSGMRGYKSDTDFLLKVASTADQIGTAAQVIEESMPGFMSSLATKAASIGASGETWEGLLKAFSNFQGAVEVFRLANREYAGVANTSPADLFSQSPRMLPEIADRTAVLAANAHGLRDWRHWIDAKQRAEKLGLTALTTAIERGSISATEAHKVFLSAYWNWWTAAAIDSDPFLRGFSSITHEALIAEFRKLDSAHQENIAAYIQSQIAKKIAMRRDTRKSSSWGQLQRYMGQSRPRVAIRKLVERYHDLLTTLAPCWMMSPLSVSQYLPVGGRNFDVVIFDEASQITTWDAIGTLARAKQVIIAGDPKQMPPTNFFQRLNEEDEEWEDIENRIPDQESILDEMEKARIPQQLLNLHYRSQKEDLIAFSNDRYYENRLITFPPPNRGKGVSLVRSGGIYDAGKSRTNLVEARQVVTEIVRRVRHPNEAIRNQSIGVVTFNKTQQELIENLLDEERIDDPVVEAAFSNEMLEPVFVKNLETVQGDERDVILFSIGYGSDKTSGPPAMRFGPVNREGGQRRLNVAFTRARQEMKIFTSLYPEQMRITPASSQGVKDLKLFLQFAEQGESILTAATKGSMGEAESPFEEEVAKALRKRGWKTESQIGVSNYRIDIGIIHPERPGEYLAGVECDGATYHSSFTARERDKLRQQILEKLGWSILRTWSTNWWHNRETEAVKLHNRLVALLEKSRSLGHSYPQAHVERM